MSYLDLFASFEYRSMLWVCGHYKYYYSYSAGIDFRSESDVYRRQILTAKVDPRTVRVKLDEYSVFTELIAKSRRSHNAVLMLVHRLRR